MNDAIPDATLARCATLPLETLVAIFARYGRPLEVQVVLEPSIAIEDARIGCFRYRSPVDVIANDWFALVHAGATLAIAAPLFVSVIERLTSPRT